MKRNRGFAVALTAPTMILLAALTIFPLLFTVYFSLTNLNMIKPDQMKFLAVKNYVRIFSDPYFIQALQNTLKFMVFAVVIETVLIADRGFRS